MKQPTERDAIRDRMRRGWVLYPHRVAGLGVLIADDAAYTPR